MAKDEKAQLDFDVWGKNVYNLMDEVYTNNEMPAEAKKKAHDNVVNYLRYLAEEAKEENKLLDMGKELWLALAREQVLMYWLEPQFKANEEKVLDPTDTDYLLGTIYQETVKTEADKRRCKKRITSTMANEFEGNVLMPEDMENACNNIIGYLQQLENGERSAKGEHWRLLVRCEAFKCWAKNGMRREMLADPELSEQEKTELVKELEKEFNRM